ncbi:variable surface protein [Plasmodium gonderi]|uniref:Variable surface protein n=1 Tax=Plasmodium gonderi TaxID=77519 RepID=A0A1Y1JNH8_PLAGO|nr:variable surface protein [Plasmodium gonderi]GAW84039.1 variable surface protein [Plasmodium gonderi]
MCNVIKFYYEIVVHFPQCKRELGDKPKEITDYINPTYWAKLCIDNTHNLKLSHLNVLNRKPQDICNQVMEYLADVNGDNIESLNEFGCEYLYYWIYELLHLKDNRVITEHVDEVYDQLLNIFISGFRTRFKYEEKISSCLKDGIKKINFPEIRAIYDMYHKIITDTYSMNNIFNHVVEIMKKHNNQIETLYGDIRKSAITSTYESSIAAPIMITILVTLLICIFIFVLLKFAKCGLWIRRAIAWKRKLWDNIGEERNIYQDPEISNSLLRDSRYNISYNYQ